MLNFIKNLINKIGGNEKLADGSFSAQELTSVFQNILKEASLTQEENNLEIPSYFKDSEFISPNDKYIDPNAKMDPALLEKLNFARHLAGKPWKVNSGIRSKEHNKAVGGKTHSAHLTGKAVDIATPSGAKRYEVISCAIQAGFNRIGINFASNFIHLDVDSSKLHPTVFSY